MPLPSVSSDLSRRVDDLCDRFEAALASGEDTSLDDWLRRAGDAADAALPELALVELEHRLKAGQHAAAADYFDRHPALAADRAAAVRLVAAEFRAAKAADPSVNEYAFRRRYPDLASQPEWSNGPWVVPVQHTVTLAHDPTPAAGKSAGNFPFNLLAPPQGAGEIGRLGGYRIKRLLGQGGMGVVLEAEEIALGRPVALKLMKPEQASSSTARERFNREARAAAAIEHPRVVIIYAVGEVNGTPYMAMPLMKGRSLADRLAAETPLPLADAVRHGREMAEGLAAAHARGLIHRDVKPDNVWLEETAEGTHVRLLDFGLVRGHEGEALTQANTVMGTPAYMAPEQAAGQPVDHRADLFSLGCVLYQMATGAKPFTGPSMMAVLSALANHHPPKPHTVKPGVPLPLSDLIDRLLSKRPEGRPGSAAEVAAELRKVESLPTGEETTVDAPLPATASRRSRWIGLIGTAAALVVVGLILALNRSRDEQPANPAEIVKTVDVPPPVAVPAKFGVASFDLKHYKAVAEKTYQDSGVLGKESFGPSLHDRVRVEATLTRPGYAYLIAFRPDGEVELCLPLDENTPPEKSDRLVYHPTATDTAYGLDEGTGLWVFSIVVSEAPLPPYSEWKKRLDPKTFWQPSSAEPGVFWHDDGSKVSRHSAAGEQRLTRGGGAKIDGPEQRLKAVTDGLNRAGKDVKAQTVSVGFGVGK